MDDFDFQNWTVTGDHHHDGYAHDEACVRTRGLYVQDWDEIPLYGVGAPLNNQHHDEYMSHDDSCLTGNGCLGLGLDAGIGDKVAYPAMPLASGFESLDRTPMESNRHLSAFEHSHGASANNTTPKAPRRYSTPNSAFLDSLSWVSEVSPTSPEDILNYMSEYGAGSERGSRDSCGSQCPGSRGPCSSGTCGEYL